MLDQLSTTIAHLVAKVVELSGIAIIATTHAACAKRYGKGPNILAHMANDAGQRAALALQYQVPA